MHISDNLFVSAPLAFISLYFFLCSGLQRDVSFNFIKVARGFKAMNFEIAVFFLRQQLIFAGPSHVHFHLQNMVRKEERTE